MTFYEELGLFASATPDEIRKAHRTVSRLLHPDQQTDESLRRAAELQMRRANSVADILLDPQRRRKYDESLRTPSRETIFASAPVRPPVSAPFSLLHLIGIAVAAVAVTLAAIWLFAGDSMHWLGNGPELNTAASAKPPAMVKPGPTRPLSVGEKKTITAPERASSSPATSRTVEPSRATMLPPALPDPVPQRDLAQTISIAPRPNGSHAWLKASADNPGWLTADARSMSPPMPILPKPAAAPADGAIAPELSFTGLWLLPSGRKAAIFRHGPQAPQYIQINIHRGQNDTVFGEYAARYEAPNRPISPEVAFTFEGPVAGDSAEFDWSARDGSRGAVELKLLNQKAMQVAWHVTEYGTRIGIAGGAAVLIRKME